MQNAATASTKTAGLACSSRILGLLLVTCQSLCPSGPACNRSRSALSRFLRSGHIRKCPRLLGRISAPVDSDHGLLWASPTQNPGTSLVTLITLTVCLCSACNPDAIQSLVNSKILFPSSHISNVITHLRTDGL